MSTINHRTGPGETLFKQADTLPREASGVCHGQQGRSQVDSPAMTSLPGRKLGILVSTNPASPGFNHAVRIAGAALEQGVVVYLYCIDDAVVGAGDARLQELKANGLKLYACAYGAQQRGLKLGEEAAYAGLTVVSDILAGTDRFLAF